MTTRLTLWQMHDLMHAHFHRLSKRTRKKGPYKLTADEITTSTSIP